MSYESIDPIISLWVANHALQLYTISRDEEVRSVDLVGSNGRKCQLWIETPDKSGNVQVHVWDYNKRKQDYSATVRDLPRQLEDAYATATSWLATPG